VAEVAARPRAARYRPLALLVLTNVIYKSSRFIAAEISGFGPAAEARDLDQPDLAWITDIAKTPCSFARAPPLRGTCSL